MAPGFGRSAVWFVDVRGPKHEVSCSCERAKRVELCRAKRAIEPPKKKDRAGPKPHPAKVVTKLLEAAAAVKHRLVVTGVGAGSNRLIGPQRLDPLKGISPQA